MEVESTSSDSDDDELLKEAIARRKAELGKSLISLSFYQIIAWRHFCPCYRIIIKYCIDVVSFLLVSPPSVNP